jgi:hypothetical protein
VVARQTRTFVSMLRAWEHVFEITGPTGAQLIGLLFVVVTLGDGFSPARSEAALRAFVTPTLINFSSVLLQSIVALSPWPSDGLAGAALALIGAVGVIYGLTAIGLKRRTNLANFDLLNWLAYNGAPIIAHAGLVGGGVGLMFAEPFAPFLIVAASTLLLAAGIFGAWDVTIWVLKRRGSS